MESIMSTVLAKIAGFRHELALEFERFILLWKYQHPVLPFTLWWRIILKRVVDFAGAAVGLVVLSPIMALVGIIIKLDSRGPIFYTQERVGRFGESFNIYKFRSMRIDAEQGGPVWWSGDNDPRMTPVGKVLRRTHLDELPQLFNVIKGEMSLVGPRPERPHFVQQLDRDIPRYDERHLIKPGMTGLAQVHYRYDKTLADVKRKLRFDLLYVRRMCLFLDARILAWTFLVVMTGRGIK
jgi:exopolysaccharide biosynthesis polyprenyl glycosylphosphotransferase